MPMKLTPIDRTSGMLMTRGSVNVCIYNHPSGVQLLIQEPADLATALNIVDADLREIVINTATAANYPASIGDSDEATKDAIRAVLVAAVAEQQRRFRVPDQTL